MAQLRMKLMQNAADTDAFDASSSSSSETFSEKGQKPKSSTPKKSKSTTPSPKTKESLWDHFSFFKKKTSKRSIEKIRQQRIRQQFKTITLLSAFSLLAILISLTFFMGWHQILIQRSEEAFINLSAKSGLVLKQAVVKNRKNASHTLVTQAINAQLNSPILGYSLQTIQAALLENPWIKSVVIQRRLPNVIHVTLEERIPVALWQSPDKKHYLVDTDGVVMNTRITTDFRSLPIIAGHDAPIHAPQMLALIEQFPEIKAHMTDMVRIRGRRWNLKLDGAVTIKLPEENVERALAKLAPLIKQNKISKQHVVSVDMRVPDHFFIKLDEKTAKMIEVSQTKHKSKVKV